MNLYFHSKQAAVRSDGKDAVVLQPGHLKDVDRLKMERVDGEVENDEAGWPVANYIMTTDV